MTAVNAGAVPLPVWSDQAEPREMSEGVALSIARGRELARLGVEEAVAEIRRRASAGRLNRGLSLSLPYFDDQSLELRRREIVIVPRGRVLFVPAFVVLACERETARARRDVAMSAGTREHLVEALERLAAAFRN